MQLKRVTITGADESVSPEQLGALADKYPLVEWGILFSQSKQGRNRYPGQAWTDAIESYWYDKDGFSMAAHLCGQWTIDFVKGDFTFAASKFKYDRLQVNMTDDTFMCLDFQKLLNTYRASCNKCFETTPIILQTIRAFQRHEWLAIINKNDSPSRFELLYDVSGGKGIQPKKWHPPVEGVHCGYAGGIGPDNVVEILKKISDVAGETPFWVDMETGVRDEADKFDIVKVESVLEQVHTYIG